MRNVSSWLIRRVWKWASAALTVAAFRANRGKLPSTDASESRDGGLLPGPPETTWFRRMLRAFWAWMLEPVPFPRDHWYEEDRRRLARKESPNEPFIISGLGLALAVSMALGARAPVAAADDAGPACTSSSSHPKKGALWQYQETANFRIWSIGSQLSPRGLAAKCETMRTNLSRTWLPKNAEETWSPKCVVVVHGDLKSYQQAIGRARDSSVGLATYTVATRQIASRRIDLRSDAEDWQANALPHELTHLVLAEKLGGQAPPCWVNEGLAVLSESRRKQDERASEVRRAIASGTIIPASRLLTLEGPPSARERDAFYGQSASLVAYLLQQRGPEQFLEFVEQSRQIGAEAALYEFYGISSGEQLDELSRLAPSASK